MDKKLNELRQARAQAMDELQGLVDGDLAAFDAKEREVKELDAKIAQTERALALAAQRAQPSNQNPAGTTGTDLPQPIIVDFEDGHSGRRVRRVPPFEHYLRKARVLLREAGLPAAPEGRAPFRSFGEQLIAIARYGMTHDIDADPRLIRAPTGAGEIDPSAGGFLVQTDFATAVFMRSYEMGEILARVEKLSLSTTANSIKIPAVDETSRATGSRWGGVQSYWVGEGVTPANTKPKFRLIELDLKKLMSLMYVTDELLADQSVLTSIAGKAFSEEIMFMTEDAIFEGSGSGQPLGIMNAPCKVTVPTETGQPTKTIVYENVLKMWSRMWARSRQNAVWFINQDNEPQLYALSQVIGTAGVPADRIELRYNDMAAPKLLGTGSFGSRSLISHGAALQAAAKEIVEKGRKLAASGLEVAPGDLVFEAGTYKVAVTDIAVSLQSLIERKSSEPTHPLDTNTTIDLASAFPSGAHIAEVEIDPDTGELAVVNYVAADDCGTIYNHSLVEGQLHGGLMQGLGQVTGEHIAYDRETGQLLSGSFMDYFMPRADNLPPITLIDCPVPSPANVLGAKGAGEAGATGSVPALANAVMDALKAVGVRQLDTPYTSDRIWQAIDHARRAKN